MLVTYKKNLVDFLPARGGRLTKTFWRNYWQFGDSIARSSGSVPTDEWKLPKNAARTENSRSIQVHLEHSANKESWARRLKSKLQCQQWLQRREMNALSRTKLLHDMLARREQWRFSKQHSTTIAERFSGSWLLCGIGISLFSCNANDLNWVNNSYDFHLTWLCTTCLNNSGHFSTVLCCLFGSVRKWCEYLESQRDFRESAMIHQNDEIFEEIRVTRLGLAKSTQ